MTFQTGDLAEFMGITNMGVLYLEKRGIIHSTRSQNGYRVFDDDTVSALALIRSYERMGFSLDEAVELSRQDASAVLLKVSQKRKNLENQLELIQYFEKWVHAMEDLPDFEAQPERVKKAMPYMHFCDKLVLTDGTWSSTKGNGILRELLLQSERINRSDVPDS